MDEERQQKELFEFKPARKRFPALAGIFRKAGIDGSVFAVTLRIDKLVFISIAIIMMMVIVYALGVERGRFVTARMAAPARAVKTLTAKTTPETRPQAVNAPDAAAAVVKETTAAMVKDTAVKPYTIAVASLSKKETAIEESAKMKAKGFDAFVVYSKPYYVVCVGAFADKTSNTSQAELINVKRFRRDAYFKKR